MRPIVATDVKSFINNVFRFVQPFNVMDKVVYKVLW